jgi:DNA-binding NtrC family response regulator
VPAEPISTPPRILVVDDDPGQRSLLESFLHSQNFDVVVAESGERALALLPSGNFAMMISDVRMPGMSGLETLRRVRPQFPALPVLLVTAYADIRDAVVAMRDGALNYLAKPIDLDELLATVRQATGMAPQAPLNLDAEKKLPPEVVAQSPLTVALFQDVALVAPSEARVLITGESGAGKEVVADVIHAWSARANGPLIKVNCAAIPETLLESELFGHEKGAFTGASNQRIGRFEEANGGTIFLDEILEMSPALQAKLLRVTQDGRFQRIGSNREIRTNARILAASNRNLEDEVKRGGSGARTSCRWRISSSASWPGIARGWPRPRLFACKIISGPAMSANCATPSSAPCFCPKASSSCPTTCRRNFARSSSPRCRRRPSTPSNWTKSNGRRSSPPWRSTNSTAPKRPRRSASAAGR